MKKVTGPKSRNINESVELITLKAKRVKDDSGSPAAGKYKTEFYDQGGKLKATIPSNQTQPKPGTSEYTLNNNKFKLDWSESTDEAVSTPPNGEYHDIELEGGQKTTALDNTYSTISAIEKRMGSKVVKVDGKYTYGSGKTNESFTDDEVIKHYKSLQDEVKQKGNSATQLNPEMDTISKFSKNGNDTTRIKDLIKGSESLNEAARSKKDEFLNDVKVNSVDPSTPTPKMPSGIYAFIPKGFYMVEKRFSISPGGGWRISFNAGELIQADGEGGVESTAEDQIKQGATEMNPFFFKTRRPPISGTTKLDFTRYGRNPDQESMIASFEGGVRPISGKEAFDYVSSVVEKSGILNESIEEGSPAKWWDSTPVAVRKKLVKQFEMKKTSAESNYADQPDGGTLDIDNIFIDQTSDTSERDFSTDERKSMADKGLALPDGSFPIENEKDLENAIHLAGNASDPAKAKAHIKKRAKELGKLDAIPDTWNDTSESFSDDVYNDIVTKLGDRQDKTVTKAEIVKMLNDGKLDNTQPEYVAQKLTDKGWNIGEAEEEEAFEKYLAQDGTTQVGYDEAGSWDEAEAQNMAKDGGVATKDPSGKWLVGFGKNISEGFGTRVAINDLDRADGVVAECIKKINVGQYGNIASNTNMNQLKSLIGDLKFDYRTRTLEKGEWIQELGDMLGTDPVDAIEAIEGVIKSMPTEVFESQRVFESVVGVKINEGRAAAINVDGKSWYLADIGSGKVAVTGGGNIAEPYAPSMLSNQPFYGDLQNWLSDPSFNISGRKYGKTNESEKNPLETFEIGMNSENEVLDILMQYGIEPTQVEFNDDLHFSIQPELLTEPLISELTSHGILKSPQVW